MAKSNYLLKAEVLENGMFSHYRYIRQTLNSGIYNRTVSKRNPYQTVEEASAMLSQFLEVYPEELKECERLQNAKRKRVKTLHKRVKYMLLKPCVFCTLTFSPETLEKTSPETRHRYVARWLKDVCGCGIANLDFGKQNGREHYHALVRVSEVNPKSWKYGNLDLERVVVSGDETSGKLAHYIGKLTNHAIKETTKGSRVIYSGYFGLPDCHDHVAKWVDDDWLTERTKRRNKAFEEEQEKIYHDEQKRLNGGFEWLTPELEAELDNIFMNEV